MGSWVVPDPAEPGRPRKTLSLGEAKRDPVMDLRHVERLHGARDLLAIRGFGTWDTMLNCYGRRLQPRSASSPRPSIRLIGLDQIYAKPAVRQGSAATSS